jgi:hypothetical protein
VSKAVALLFVLGALLVGVCGTVRAAQVPRTATPTAAALVALTPAATLTPTPTATRTAVVVATATSTAAVAPTPSALPATPLLVNQALTPTPRATLQATPTRTPTLAATRTPTPVATATVAATATMTRVPTRTPLPSATATQASTATPLPPPPRIQGPLRSSVVGASSARIEWTTNVPTTGQVEFGTTPTFGSTTGIDVAVSTSHAVTVRGLTPGTLYYFRVNSMDDADRAVTSAISSFTTLPRGRAAPIDDVLARRVTATTALLEWTASSAIAQVEYGLTPAYDRFTLLQTFTAMTQEMLLTDLRPASVYHFRIKTWTASGATAVSEDYTFTTAPAQTATLLGERVMYDARYSLAFGQLKAFQFAAQASGLATLVPVYVDAATSATSLSVGLYADRAGRPEALLGQAMIPRLTPGTWNLASLRPTNLVQGTTYWLVLLNPTGGSGTLVFRGANGPGSSLLSGPRIHTALPVNWVSEVPLKGGAVSAFVLQTVPAVTVTGPAEGDSVSSPVTVRATVDADGPVAGVEFLVDGLPVGEEDRAAPYELLWNATDPGLHTFSARATDAGGRVAAAAPVAVHVDIGPTSADGP